MYYEVSQSLVGVAGMRQKDTSEMQISSEVLPLYPLRATRDDLSRANLIVVRKYHHSI